MDMTPTGLVRVSFGMALVGTILCKEPADQMGKPCLSRGKCHGFKSKVADKLDGFRGPVAPVSSAPPPVPWGEHQEESHEVNLTVSWALCPFSAGFSSAGYSVVQNKEKIAVLGHL